MDHPMIYRLVVQESPSAPAAVSAAAADLWAEAKDLILRIDERISRAMDRSSDGWEGSAADSTRSAMSPLAQWAADAAGDAKLTADGVELQAFQATYVRNAMPAPDDGAVAGEPGALPRRDPAWILTDQAARENEAANRAARAVELMEHYTNVSYEARSYMDYWTPPPQVAVEVAPASPSGGGAGVAGWVGAESTSVSAAAAAPAGSGPGGQVGVGNAGPVGLGAGAGAATAGAGASAAGDGLAGTSGGVAGTPGAARPGGPPAGHRPSAGGAAATAGGPSPGSPAVGAPRFGAGVARAPAGRAASAPGSLPYGGPAGPAGGFRPVVPGPPARSAPAPSWRDVVRGNAEALPPPRSSAGPVRGPGGFGESAPPPGRGAGTPFPAATTATASAGSAGTSRPGHPPMMAPMTGMAAGQEREHRRPSYLVDDTDAFADDRWVTLPVMSPDDPLPRPPP